ncbi:MAG: dehydrogenase, partial [Cytophagaceae bacterium]
KYVPAELFREWEKKDPVANFENYLLNEQVLTAELITAIKQELKTQINEQVEAAFNEPEPVADPEKELSDMYAPYTSPSTTAI